MDVGRPTHNHGHDYSSRIAPGSTSRRGVAPPCVSELASDNWKRIGAIGAIGYINPIHPIYPIVCGSGCDDNDDGRRYKNGEMATDSTTVTTPPISNQYSTLVRVSQYLTKQLRYLTQMSGRARRKARRGAITYCDSPACHKQRQRHPLAVGVVCDRGRLPTPSGSPIVPSQNSDSARWRRVQAGALVARTNGADAPGRWPHWGYWRPSTWRGRPVCVDSR